MQNVNESNIFTPLTENLSQEQFKIQIILFKKILILDGSEVGSFQANCA